MKTDQTEINPFIHKIEIPWYRWIQIAVMSVTIAPLRFVTGIWCVMMAWLFTYLIHVGETAADFTTPDNSLGRSIVTKIVKCWLKMFFFVMGFHNVTLIGKKVKPYKAPFLCAAPHTSMLDAILSCFTMPTTLITTTEQAAVPIIGRLLRFAQPVLVERESRSSRFNCLRTLETRSRKTYNGTEVWPQCIIFPEGTTTNGKCLITFKAGAFKPGVPIQPVILKWHNQWDTTTWTWDGPTAYQCIWLTLCQFNMSVSLEFLPVYVPNELERNDSTLFANNVRKVMADALEVPFTDHSYEDCRLMVTAGKHGLPKSASIVEFTKLCCKLPINYDNVEAMLEDFLRICSSQLNQDDRISDLDEESGGVVRMDWTQFERTLGLIDNDELKRVFQIFDKDGSGVIDFRQFVVCFAMVTRPGYIETNFRLAFRLFDQSRQDAMSATNFNLLMKYAFCLSESKAKNIFRSIGTADKNWTTLDEFVESAHSESENNVLANVVRVNRSLRLALEQAGNNTLEQYSVTSLKGTARLPNSFTDDDEEVSSTNLSSSPSFSSSSGPSNKMETVATVHTRESNNFTEDANSNPTVTQRHFNQHRQERYLANSVFCCCYP